MDGVTAGHILIFFMTYKVHVLCSLAGKRTFSTKVPVSQGQRGAWFTKHLKIYLKFVTIKLS